MTRRGRPRRTGAAGFSLLELLVAIAVLGLSLGMIYQADVGVLRSVGEQSARQRAAILAQSLLDARDAVAATGWSEQGEAVGLRWSVASAVQPLPPGLPENATPLHEVVVTVRWNASGRGEPHEWVLRTLLPQALPQPAGAATP